MPDERGRRGLELVLGSLAPQSRCLSSISGLVALQKSERADVKEMKGVLETLLAYHYLHRSRADLRPRLSKVLKQMLLDGTTQRLRKETYAKLLEDER